MLKLDENDIKVVASERYYRKRRWFLVGGVIVVLIVGLVILYFLKDNWSWVAILPLLIYAAVLVLDQIKLKRFVREFVAVWKKEGVN